jgi:RNA polymerase sigma-70 factor (ECF subfamily)
MNDYAGRLAGRLGSIPLSATDATDAVHADEAVARDFEARLADSSTLAFRVAYGVLRQRQDAEDVAQEAFAKAYRNFRQLRDREAFRGWLVRMTWRLALDHRRGHLRRLVREQAAIDAPAAPAVSSAEDDLIARERSARLWRAIDALPERLRLVIVLASIEGHGIQEVADLVGAPAGTVKSRLFEARKQLQEMLR